MPRWVRRTLYRLFASTFVAGETYQEAVPKIERLTREGFHVTVDILGEDVTERTQVQDAVEKYLRLIDDLATAQVADINISIKLTMIGLLQSEEVARQNLYWILLAARNAGAFVRVDMEDPNVRLGEAEESLTAVTLRIVRSFLPEFANHVGVVLQAYLDRTTEDLRHMTALHCRIRLCKGAYRASDEIAATNRRSIQQRYQRDATHLLAHGRMPAFATHDDVLIDWVLGGGRTPRSFEFQMLYGIRSERAKALLEAGHRVRLYIPVGDAWWPYFRRRLKEGHARQLLVMFARNLFAK